MKTKEKEDELKKMSDKELKEFLDNDFIERVIRVEQNVSAHFRKLVPYSETLYYKSLSEKEKKSFERYLKRKKLKKRLMTGIIFISLISLLFLRTPIVGRVIGSGKEVKLSLIESFLLIIVFSGIVAIIFSSFGEKIKNKKFEKHLKVIEDLIAKRYMTKKF